MGWESPLYNGKKELRGCLVCFHLQSHVLSNVLLNVLSLIILAKD